MLSVTTDDYLDRNHQLSGAAISHAIVSHYHGTGALLEADQAAGSAAPMPGKAMMACTSLWVEFLLTPSRDSAARCTLFSI